MERAHLNTTALYAALDAARRSRGLSWRQVAKAAQVSPSTLTRLAQGKRPDVDGFAAIVSWLGIAADRFIQFDRKTEPDPMAAISTLLRASSDLSAESAQALEEILLAAFNRLRNR